MNTVRQNVGVSALDVDLGDVDGDGDLDAFALGRTSTNRVWLNNGDGVFTDSGQTLGNANGFAIELGDLDGDSDLDAFVVYGVNTSQPNKVYFNDGSGNFSDSGQNLGNTDGSDVGLGDLDGDGDLDAFVSRLFDNPNEVWLNDGHGFFSNSGQALGNSGSYSLALGDVDGDGDIDAFIATIDADETAPNEVWLNNGKGIFTDSGQRLGNLGSAGVVLGDLDGDGDRMLFVVNRD
ncbi:MAG: VCBS repeat-containing protein [Ardenticatenaceae bacterium]|nr:VCBS repeat-containing protein [Ardenticatenaceae bacterium]